MSASSPCPLVAASWWTAPSKGTAAFSDHLRLRIAYILRIGIQKQADLWCHSSTWQTETHSKSIRSRLVVVVDSERVVECSGNSRFEIDNDDDKCGASRASAAAAIELSILATKDFKYAFGAQGA